MTGKISRAAKLHEAADFIVENFYNAVLRPNVALKKEEVIRSLEENGGINVLLKVNRLNVTNVVHISLGFNNPIWEDVNLREDVSMAGMIMRQVAYCYYRKGQDAAKDDMRRRLGLEQ